MNRKITCLAAWVALVFASINVATSYAAGTDNAFLKAGKRLLVQAKGRKDYYPRIVECDSSSVGLCLRDTRGDPANNPLEPYDDGKLRVNFKSWHVTYVISPDGTGIALDGDGKELGPFKWSLK